MIFDVIWGGFSFFSASIYKTLNQHLVGNFLLFIRGFEVAIFVIVAIIFLLIAVSIALRKLKRLPQTYEIQILDLDGKEAIIDGLRQVFHTYDAAESFARQYRKTYANQYQFKVIGKSSEKKKYNKISPTSSSPYSREF
jgi:hypothetical protein